MIDIKVKIHDKFSFELKTSFITTRNSLHNDTNEFGINTWLFLPNNLDINRSTYSKERFYRDTKSHVRLITPVYTLKEIYTKANNPIEQLTLAFKTLVEDPHNQTNIDNYAYHIRMFSCIFKSATRNNVYLILNEQDDSRIEQLVDNFITNIITVLEKYRELWAIIDTPEIDKDHRDSFRFGNGFIGNIVEQQTFRIMIGLEKREPYKNVKEKLVKLVEDENKYKRIHNYSMLDKDDPSNNYLVVMRRGTLKKFIESDLYLTTKKSKDGAFAEQFYYGIAAAISMVFATVVAFTAQQRYGNFTTPLFFALVISYVFKDRIKDLMRYYFSNQLGKKYFDTKRELEITDRKIGFTKEAFDFVPESKLPEEVINLRQRSPLLEAENRIYNEQIILFKKRVQLKGRELSKDKNYQFIGINDITRFNITSFIQKSDNPFVSLYVPDEKEGYQKFKGEKVYALHFIIRLDSQNDVHYRKYRMLFNRDGIKEIDEIKD